MRKKAPVVMAAVLLGGCEPVYELRLPDTIGVETTPACLLRVVRSIDAAAQSGADNGDEHWINYNQPEYDGGYGPDYQIQTHYALTWRPGLGRLLVNYHWSQRGNPISPSDRAFATARITALHRKLAACNVPQVPLTLVER